MTIFRQYGNIFRQTINYTEFDKTIVEGTIRIDPLVLSLV